MNNSRGDQNTILLIVGILVVSILTIVAILSSTWSLIREPVNMVVSQIQEFIRNNRQYDYNFPVLPASYTITTNEKVTTETTRPEDGNKVLNINKTPNLPSFEGSVLKMSEIIDLKQSPKINLRIPNIDIVSNVYQGNDLQQFVQNHFFISEVSSDFGKGTTILLCKENNEVEIKDKFCSKLQNLRIGDDLIFDIESNKAIYKFFGKKTVQFNSEEINKIETEHDIIRLISLSKESGNERILYYFIRSE